MRASCDGENGKIFVQSEQIKMYDHKSNRVGFADLYDSEKHSLDYVLPSCSSVIDIGCLNGDTLKAIKDKYPVACTGIDIDEAAIEIARAKYEDVSFRVGDFTDGAFSCPKADLVLALNLFDHFGDWKTTLINLKRFSHRFINISTLMRLSGPTLLDPETNFLYYSGGTKRLLWAVHSIFELAAYAATESINATSIYVYCYAKYDNERFHNAWRASHCCHAISPTEMLVGNVVIEWDDNRGMQITKRRPDLKIVLNDQVVFDSPWRGGSDATA